MPLILGVCAVVAVVVLGRGFEAEAAVVAAAPAGIVVGTADAADAGFAAVDNSEVAAGSPELPPAVADKAYSTGLAELAEQAADEGYD